MANDDRSSGANKPPAAPPRPAGKSRSVAPPPPRRAQGAVKAQRAAPPPPPVRSVAPPLPPPPPARRPAVPRSDPHTAPPPSPRSDPKAAASPVAPPAAPAGAAAQHLKTQIGFAAPPAGGGAPAAAAAPPPVDPRVEQAESVVASCEAELAKGAEPLRAGRLHYEIARLCEDPLRDNARAAEHYQKAHATAPDLVPAMRGARRTLIAEKNYQAALPLFDAEARITSDPRHKALLLYEKGRLLEDQMAQKRQARDAYAAAIELAKDDPTLLKTVERADAQAEAWDDLERIYEREAQAAQGDARLKAALIADRARLVEAKKGDAGAATELYQAALGADQHAPGALAALKRLLYAARRWRELVAVLEQEAAQAGDPAVRAMALYRAARVEADRMGDLERATALLERASADKPDDSMLLEELARLYELGKRYDALAGAFERLVAHAEGPAQKVGLMHRIGQIAEERLGDDTQALRWYGQALAQDPTYVPGLQAQGALFARRQQWAELVAMHLAEADAQTDSTRRAAAHARVAEIYESQLGAPGKAVEHHARALGMAPGYGPSFKALSRLYAEAGKHRELVELYERAVEGAPDAETRVTYLFKIGRLHEDALGAPALALAAYRRVLDVEPGHLGAIHAMQRAAERAAEWKELVVALELEAGVVKDAVRICALLNRAGEICDERLDDREGALMRYRKVIALDPRYAPALSSLGRLYYKAARWEELIEVYRKELDITPRGPASAALLYKIGELGEERLGNDERAIAAYREAIEADPFHAPALHALGRKLAERGNWQELCKLLELEVSGLKDEELKARAAFRVGEVYENRLLQVDKALVAYEQALASVPDFRPALDGRVRLLTLARDDKRLVEALEREVATAKDPGMAIAALLRQGEVLRDQLDEPARAMQCFEAVLERDPGHLGALRALEPLYAEVGAWEKLVRVYATEARVLTDAPARVAALCELARLQESKELASVDQVRQTYFAILQLVPSDLYALTALERIALATQDHQLLAHVDAKLGAAAGDPTLVAAHHTRLAETLELTSDPAALEVYRAALARDPENIAAARGLGRIAKQREDAELLEEAAEREARVVRDVAAAADLLVLAAELRGRRQDLEGAARALERAVELDPDHRVAAEQLLRMTLVLGQPDRAIDALVQAAQHATLPPRIGALWAGVASVFADHKQDVPAALAALHRAVERLPGDVPTLLALSDLYVRDGQSAEAVDRLKQVLAQSPSRETMIRAHLALAAILDERLGDPQRAVASLNAVLSQDEGNRDALKRLLGIQMRRGQTEAAAATAAKLVGGARDPAEQADALTHLARLERDRKQTEAALKAYEQAVAFVGPGAIADEMRELLLEQKRAGQQPDWARYVGALTRYLERTSQPAAAQAPVYLEMGRILADEMQMADRAVATLQRGLALAPDDVQIRTEVASRFKRAGRYDQAIAELRTLLDLDVMRAETWRDLAESFGGLGRTDDATLMSSALVAIGAANDLERATVAARPSRAATAQPGSFDAVAFRNIDALPRNDAALELLASLAEALPKIQPPELERYGLSSRDKLSARTGNPLRALSDRVAQIFGVAEHDLYVHRAHSGSLEVELTEPPAILVPAHVTTLPEPQQVFLLARPLASMARGIHAVHKLPPEAIELLLAAATRAVDPGFAAGLTDEEYLAAHARRVQKAMPRRGRRAMEEAAQVYAGAARTDFADWVQRARLTAGRAAVVVADDLPGSVTLVRRMEGDLAKLQGAALAQGMASVRDLLRFWATDIAFTLRRKLGM